MQWRWTIRVTCLALRLFSAGVWLLTFFFYPTVGYRDNGSLDVSADAFRGISRWTFQRNLSNAGLGQGWRVCWEAEDHPELRLSTIMAMVGGDALGFTVTRNAQPPFLAYWQVEVPLWFPTALLGLLAWIAWRKTRGPGRGFAVEPLAAPQQQTQEL